MHIVHPKTLAPAVHFNSATNAGAQIISGVSVSIRAMKQAAQFLHTSQISGPYGADLDFAVHFYQYLTPSGVQY